MDKLKPTGVNPIRFNPESSTWIQPSKSEFSTEISEESKRRLINHINSEIDKSLEQFKDKVNNQEIRDYMIDDFHKLLSKYLNGYESHINCDAKRGPNDTLIMSMTAKDRIGQSIILKIKMSQLKSMIEQSGSVDLIAEFSSFASLLTNYLDNE